MIQELRAVRGALWKQQLQAAVVHWREAAARLGAELVEPTISEHQLQANVRLLRLMKPPATILDSQFDFDMAEPI